MRSYAIHVHKHSVEAMLLQQCREVTTVILSITPWLPSYMRQSLIRCNNFTHRLMVRPKGSTNLLSNISVSTAIMSRTTGMICYH